MAVDFAKSNYCAKSNQYVIETFFYGLTIIFFFQFCCIVNYNSILNIFIEVVLAISSKIYTNNDFAYYADFLYISARLISRNQQDWFREINKTDFAKSTGVNNFLN